ncbi:phage minor capsid protein [Evansella tamaricis]|uniref:Phage minor capsid protein n=1 Tax=Evansella tamaricis TaxID=2069301 RepID=A0ABS6JNP3_9BACI|nr:phage minor capsid protein [Evansella tamaricis]MBU9714427.1 phage minor capsid protein [Evansella tamaricis]
MSIDKLDRESNKLVNDYKISYISILELLEEQIDRGLSERQARSILREIQLELKHLDEEAYKWSYDVLPEYYLLSLHNIDTDFAYLNGVNVIRGEQIVLHKHAIANASRNTYTDLAKNTAFMNEEAKRIIRSNASELLTMQTITGQDYKKTKKQLKDALVSQGVTSFVDAGGKHWKIEDYSSMLVRSKSRTLHNRGTMNRLEEYQDKYPSNENFGLIRISSHNSTCWCGAYENTVWSIKGNHPMYPSIKSLPNQPYENLHPNCRHVFLSYMPELARMRGDEGIIISTKYQNRTIKDLNKELYHQRH